MATEVTMPKLSDTMTEGKLVSWKKSVGERVEWGDIIAEVETDKATMELEAFAAGVLLETRIKPGEMAPVGTVIAVIGAAGEGVSAPPPPAAPAPEPESPAPPELAPGWQPPAPEPPHEPLEAGEVPERIMAPSETGAVEEKPSVAAGAAGEKASPLVRRLAREKGIDLAGVQGSGPEGRILKEDLERYDQARGAGREALGRPEEAPVKSPTGGMQPLSRMRAAIARTVAESWRTIPHFYVTVEIDMGEAERVRQELKESAEPVSVNDMIVKACALTLEKFTRVNASFAGDRIELHEDINIGIAVAIEEGLIVPVVRGCQSLSLQEIALRSRELVEKGRAGKISEAEIGGGTFTISNMGMYGTDEFAAVILPPQGAILAVGAVADRPVIRTGHLVVARMMRATLSADHRLLDGVYAAQFLRELKKVLENPVTMLV
jgi:pyruvate dehydrogenase E2 component (dihydrolipoamide acetyltransferase)